MTSPVSPYSGKSWSEPGVSATLMSLGAVLICKEYSEPYRDAFLKRGLTPYFLQVLESRLVNQDLLKQTIQDGPGTKYGGVIITSSRAANAWVACFKDALVEHSSPSATKWQNIPFYVVGKATEAALRASEELLPAPLEILGAQTAGTGEKLARLIVGTCDKSSNSDTNEDPRPNFLYLTGDKNRETIPEVLSKAGFNYHKMQVYETFSASDLSTELVKVALQMQADSRSEVPDNEQWLALFSPSTASYVLEAWEAVSQKEPRLRNSAFRLAAIGPTTDEYLTTHGHEVASVSARPDAVSLAEAICASTLQRRSLADSISASGEDMK